MLKIRWTLVLTFAALATFALPGKMQLGVLAALAFGAAALAAVTVWGRTTETRTASARDLRHRLPLRELLTTKDELPSPSGTHLRPSAGF